MLSKMSQHLGVKHDMLLFKPGGCFAVQVAGRVDMLDGRVKQEQESSLRALEAILSESGHSKR